MTLSSLTSRLAVVLTLTAAQSIPGGSYLQGGGLPGGGTYQLVDDYEPSIFFNKFNLYSSYDPTYGHVQYVNQTVATQNGFISTTSSGTAKISVDTTNKWPRGGPGRPSVRLISDNTYGHGLFVFDAIHMPWGCGTWPAYWLLGPNWPYTGEIDIIEGVNTNTQNSISLHSSQNCTVAGSGQTGTLQTTNCDVNANGNSGCGSTLSNTTIPNNYGSGFNNNGGGVYVTEWTSSYFKTWFFARGNIPASITNGNPDPSKFGTPAVNHQGSCNIDAHFSNMSIIINIDFCGAWAGQVYSQYGDCPQNTSTSSLNSCVDFVGNNPSYFTNAYFEINSIKVYQMPVGAQASSSYTTSLSSVAPQSTATANSINLGMGRSTTSASSIPYTGPISSLTASASPAATTPAICPSYNNTVWQDGNSQGYSIGCGFDYNGAGTGLPGSGIYTTSSFEACLELCDTTAGCLALAYTGGNLAGTCYLKASKGALVFTGNVNAAVKVVASGTSAAATSTPSSPACPGSASTTYTDSQGVSYAIICYTDYAGNNIGTPISFNSLAACLPACDSMSGCAGAVFNVYYNLCTLKSSFTGTQTGNNSVVAARRVAAVASSQASIASTTSSALGYGGGGYGYSQPGYGGAYSQFFSSTATTATSSSSMSSSASSSIRSTSSTLTASSTAALSLTVSSSASSLFSSTISSTSSTLPPSSTATGISTTPTSSVASSTTAMTSTTELSSTSMTSSSSSSMTTSSELSTPSTTSSFPSDVSSSSTTSSTTSSASTSTSTTATSLSSMLSTTLTSLSITSTYAASQLPGASTATSITSASPCPSNAAGYCSQPTQQSRVCSDSVGAIYYVACNIVYTGSVIDTAGIYGRDLEPLVRATVPDVASCQRLCDQTTGCVAFNFVGSNCVLLSTVDGGVSNANAIGGSLIRAAPPPATSTSISTTTSVNPGISSSSVVQATVTTTAGPAITVTATTTASLPPGGYFTSGSSGSFYVYSSSSVGSVSLCYTCGLTPTVVTDPTQTVSICLTTTPGTTTVFTTSTITSCPPQPTCPASGYLIVGGSQSYPGQQVITTTNKNGDPITYTQIPSTNTATVTAPGATPSGGSGNPPGASNNTESSLLACPGADGSVFTDSMGMRYRILCGVEFTDTTLDTQSQSTLGGCISSCDAYNVRNFQYGSPCLGVSWFSNITTDNCLLKGGQDPVARRNCDSCALLTVNGPTRNNTITATGAGPTSYGLTTYTTVVGRTTAVSVFTTTLPASTVTIYTTIFTGGSTIVSGISTTTIPASTITETTTQVIPGSTIVTVGSGGPGYYGGNGGGPNRPGEVPSTVYGVSTGVSTYVTNGQTVLSTYGVTTVQSVVYLPAPTQTVTTTTLSVSLVPTTYTTTVGGQTTTIVTYVPAGGGAGYYGGGGGGGGGGGTQTQTVTTTSVQLSITLVPTTIITTVSQGYTTTIITYVPRTYTQPGGYGGSGGVGSGGTDAGGGTVTVTLGTAPPSTTTVFVTVTQIVLPSSASSSFTCRTYATNYLNGLHGRAEPTSAPMMRNGIVLQPVVLARAGRRKSVFNKDVVMAEVARMHDVPAGILSGELDLWWIE